MSSNIPQGYEVGKLQNYTPEQMQLFQSMFQHVGPESFTARLAGGDPSMFAEMERPALKQFGAMQGNMASRFSGMGSGARRSSGFANTMTQGAADFASQLQSQRIGLQNQAVKDLMTMSGQLLDKKPYEQFLIQQDQSPSGFDAFMQGAMPLVGAGIGAMAGGPMGMAVGSQIGGMAGSAFGGQPYQANWQGIGNLPTKWGS